MKLANKIFGLRGRQAGFSLLEVTVVVSIIGIMTIAGLVSMHADKQDKDLETEAFRVAASLRQAQNFALTGKLGASGSKPCLFRWRNHINSGGTPNDSISYWIRGWDGVDGTCSGANGDNSAYSLQNGVTFKNSNNVSDIIDFLVPFGTLTDAYNTGTQDADRDTVTLQKNSNCVDISINSAGMVTEGQIYNCP